MEWGEQYLVDALKQGRHPMFVASKRFHIHVANDWASDETLMARGPIRQVDLARMLRGLWNQHEGRTQEANRPTQHVEIRGAHPSNYVLSPAFTWLRGYPLLPHPVPAVTPTKNQGMGSSKLIKNEGIQSAITAIGTYEPDGSMGTWCEFVLWRMTPVLGTVPSVEQWTTILSKVMARSLQAVVQDPRRVENDQATKLHFLKQDVAEIMTLKTSLIAPNARDARLKKMLAKLDQKGFGNGNNFEVTNRKAIDNIRSNEVKSSDRDEAVSTAMDKASRL